jgi:hypothetical protein
MTDYEYKVGLWVSGIAVALYALLVIVCRYI